MPKFTCTCSSSWVSRRGGVSQWNKAFGESVVEACKYWHENFLPFHMTMEAYGRYTNPASEPTYVGKFDSYAIRKESYTKWKRKLYKHENPLMFTGDAMRDTTASPDFRWSKAQGTGNIEAVCTFGIGNADRGRGARTDKGIKNESPSISSNQIREEFTAVSRDELEEMSKVFESELDIQIDKVMMS